MTRSAAEILASMPAVITGRQLRAARTLARLSRLQLAEAAGIGEETVIRLEQCGEQPITTRLETKLSLAEALYQAGVLLKDNEGVERIAP